MSEGLPDVDVAIVGGGLLGTPLALMLAHAGWHVALLEQGDFNSDAIAHNNMYDPLQQRCTALSAASVQLLAQHALWEPVADDACAIRQVHISQNGHFGSTQLNAREHGVAALGHVIENARFTVALQLLLPESGVHCLQQATVSAIEQHANHAQLTFTQHDQTRQLSAKLVIAVDGVKSGLRDYAGIAATHTDYDQVGIMGAVKLSQPHQNVAYERFASGGPLAMLPRPNDVASFVYCIDPHQQQALSALSDAEFLAHLQQVFGYRLGRFAAVGSRHTIPLVRIEAQTQTSRRLLLLGNAARLLHPVAGQGYNLALRDVAQLLKLLAGETASEDAPMFIRQVPESKQAQAEPPLSLRPQSLRPQAHQQPIPQRINPQIDAGSAMLLDEFVRSRKPDQLAAVRLTDTLARTFRGRSRMPGHARALGLIGLDAITPVKTHFARRAMGFAS